jgi:hypothetical protein
MNYEQSNTLVVYVVNFSNIDDKHLMIFNLPFVSILVKKSVPVPCDVTIDFDNIVSNSVSLSGYAP